jgi:outer membrane protein OmpA-like peptidoglycan-associated protein
MASSLRLFSATGALAAATFLASAAAHAQGLPLNRFDPAPVGDRMFGVQSPFVAGHLTPHVGVLLDYAHNPLVLRNTVNDSDAGAVVSGQLFLHVNASLALWNRLLVNVNVPVALLQDGGGSTAAGALPAVGGAQLGEVRAGLRLRLWGEYDDLFQVGVGGYAWFPTGPSTGYVGSGDVRGMPQVLLGGRSDRVVWSFAAGPQFRATQSFANVSDGLQINAGAGVGLLLGEKRHFQIGPEVYTAFTVASDGKALHDELRRSSNVEVLLDARYRIVDDVEIGLGAGPGLTAGLGTPAVRGVFMLAYTPEQKREEPPSDRDKDGILDAVDACPDVKGVASEDPKKHGCPPPSDRDRDGIVDEVDACPDVKGVASDDPKKHGCPADRDGDGILDLVDACVDVKGVASDDPKQHGCPPDRDGDGIVDDVDACPDVKGVASSDPKKNGCPPDTDGDGILDGDDACPTEAGPADPNPKKHGCPVVHVTDKEIVILEQVQFDTGKATIKKASDPLLEKVAAVFAAHVEITKVEVQGHTDNVGQAGFNRALSQRRAEEVVKALVKRGIAKERLVAKGYGPSVPIADNKTAEGRQENRRVQFSIIEKSKQPEPAK